MKNTNTLVKVGTVFAGKKSPSVHNEIVRFFVENGKKYAEVEQYSKDIETKSVIFTVAELKYIFKRDMAYVILTRSA